MRNRVNYEADDETFSADAYRLAGDKYAVAWYIRGWDLEPVSSWCCQDCERSGYERDGGGGSITHKGDPDCEHESIAYSDEPEYIRTGRVVATMVGDDAHHVYDQNDFEPIAREAYCGECGQIGCSHDGLDRSA